MQRVLNDKPDKNFDFLFKTNKKEWNAAEGKFFFIYIFID